MDNGAIQTLVKVLHHKSNTELAELLEGASSEIADSGQYGSHHNATLCTFIIFAPLEKYFRLKQLTDNQKSELLEALLDVYPHADEEPEITGFEVRLLREPTTPDPTPQTMTEKSNVEIFISYSTKDKDIAGEVKRAITDAGMTAFLAHEDIRPSAEWVQVILDNLGSCDIFVPLFTSNFRLSDWTAQEAGFAFAKDKLIIPVSVSGTDDNIPFGLVGKFQSLKLDSAKAYEGGDEIVETIVERGQEFPFKYRLVNGLVEKLAISGSFDNAGKRAQLLTKISDMDADQINKLFTAVSQNDQIYRSRSASAPLITLFKRYKNRISESNVEALRSTMPEFF